MLNPTIDPTTAISIGTQLSKNFILGHVSSGAYNYVLGRIIPTFTSFLVPGRSSIPIWQVAKNLQMGSQTILENLMTEFGGDLIIRSGFMGSLNNALGIVQDINAIKNNPAQLLQNPQLAIGLTQSMGQSFEVQVRGFENNMYGVSKTIQKLVPAAKNIGLIYGNSSFMRLQFDDTSIKSRFNNTSQQISTHDLLGNVMEIGLTSIKGLL